MFASGMTGTAQHLTAPMVVGMGLSVISCVGRKWTGAPPTDDQASGQANLLPEAREGFAIRSM
jgi:hypothetical protein